MTFRGEYLELGDKNFLFCFGMYTSREVKSFTKEYSKLKVLFGHLPRPVQNIRKVSTPSVPSPPNSLDGFQCNNFGVVASGYGTNSFHPLKTGGRTRWLLTSFTTCPSLCYLVPLLSFTTSPFVESDREPRFRIFVWTSSVTYDLTHSISPFFRFGPDRLIPPKIL